MKASTQRSMQALRTFPLLVCLVPLLGACTKAHTPQVNASSPRAQDQKTESQSGGNLCQCQYGQRMCPENKDCECVDGYPQCQ
ncbi:hypothetical protein JQX13_04075 [Archangium violaceum]|uniref:hypothetical protein n=1 Tax=Archangium violaceum TaxID=83451 RepID=UPI00193BAB58|nr:hypothetical protein [Archangium violaceum]QRK09333.1 hypothetical protein JQX13_04075 [Archangium violaceum]